MLVWVISWIVWEIYQMNNDVGYKLEIIFDRYAEILDKERDNYLTYEEWYHRVKNDFTEMYDEHMLTKIQNGEEHIDNYGDMIIHEYVASTSWAEVRNNIPKHNIVRLNMDGDEIYDENIHGEILPYNPNNL